MKNPDVLLGYGGGDDKNRKPIGFHFATTPESFQHPIHGPALSYWVSANKAREALIRDPDFDPDVMESIGREEARAHKFFVQMLKDEETDQRGQISPEVEAVADGLKFDPRTMALKEYALATSENLAANLTVEEYKRSILRVPKDSINPFKFDSTSYLKKLPGVDANKGFSWPEDTTSYKRHPLVHFARNLRRRLPF